MSLKVLIVVPNDSLGGAEQYLKMKAKYYASQGANVKIYFLRSNISNGWDEFKGDVNVELFYPKRALEVLGVLFLIKKVFGNACVFDIVFSSHVKVTSLLGVLIRLNILKTKRFIARESTSIFKRFTGVILQLYKLMYTLGYGKVDVLICQTDYMREQLIEALPYLKSKTVTIPNPIDFDLIKKQEAFALAEDELGEYIVSAGRLIPEKGFDLLIKAFKEVLVNSPKEIKLLILGEGIERKKLENTIIEEDLEGKVILKGFVNNVYPYFKHAKLCVVSSRVEGFPNVLLQMMSQNDCVVSTLCAGGIDEIPGLFTCEADNENQLFVTIKEALELEKNQTRHLFDVFLSERTIAKTVAKIEKQLD